MQYGLFSVKLWMFLYPTIMCISSCLKIHSNKESPVLKWLLPTADTEALSTHDMIGIR